MLLDEPSDGPAPTIVEQIAAVIATMRSEGVAVLLVEKGALVHRVPTLDFRRDPETAGRLLGVS